MTTMTYEQEKESLARVLRDKIFSYKAARPNLSSSQIASKFGMSSSTFSRLENLDIKTPTFDQVVKIFNGVGDRDALVQYLEINYPNLTGVFQEYIAKGMNPFLTPEMCSYLEDPTTSKLMILAGSKSGLPQELVKEEFGNSGLAICVDLVEKDLLVNREGRFFINSTSSGITNKTILELIKNVSTGMFDLAGLEAGDALNYISFRSESIDLERVYPQIVSILKETNAKIKLIMDNPENRGEDTVYVGVISDSILKNKLTKNKRKMQ